MGGKECHFVRTNADTNAQIKLKTATSLSLGKVNTKNKKLVYLRVQMSAWINRK